MSRAQARCTACCARAPAGAAATSTAGFSRALYAGSASCRVSNLLARGGVTSRLPNTGASCGRVARVLVCTAHGAVMPAVMVQSRGPRQFYTGFSTTVVHQNRPIHLPRVVPSCLQSYTAIHAIQLYSYTALYTIHAIHHPSALGSITVHN